MNAQTLEKLRWRLRQAGAAVQKLVVQALLILLYLFGFGLTRALAALFARKYLGLFASEASSPSLWRDAEGYDQDLEGLRGQN